MELKSFKKNYKKIIVLLIIFVVFIVTMFYKSSNVLRMTNIIHSEKDKFIDEFKGKYKDYYLVKVEGFTHYYENRYLRLVSMNSFNDVYIPNHVYLREGRWPENNNEVVLPILFKKGAKYSEGKNSYLIGDTIELNHAPYRNKIEVVTGTSNYMDVEVKYSIDCAKDTPYVLNDEYNYKEYKVVGFYDYYMYKLDNKKGENLIGSDWNIYGSINVITYLDEKTLEDDDRVMIIMKLKHFSFTNRKLREFSRGLIEKYSRYEESVQVTTKTCNDKFSIGNQSDWSQMRDQKRISSFVE